MATRVVMPELGESVDEGTIGKWLKKVGDTVAAYEPLLEVITDKVDTEITAPASGTLLKTFVSEGDVIAAGTTLAFIGEPGEDISGESVSGGATAQAVPTPEPAMPEPVPVAATTTALGPASGNGTRHNGQVSPLVRRIAAEHNLDVAQIPGTGRDGRVTKHDIMAFIEQGGAPAVAVAPAPGADRPAPLPAPVPQGVPGEIVELSNIRRRIADHMVLSKLKTAPHVTTIFELDMSAVWAHRNAHKAAFEQQGAKLTFTAYLVAASAAALRAYPMVNSQWTDEGILLKQEVNVGVAAATDAGLIVPVVKNADNLSLVGIARTVNDLANRARASQLKPDDITGGTFTISNHGVSGSLFATPIISQPQTAILGVGAIQKRVVVVTDAGGTDAIAIRPMMYLGLTFDHRVLDGAEADYFLVHMKHTLENWQ